MSTSFADGMDFRVLGPVEVWVAGEQVELGPPKQRALLAILILNAGRVVAQERLMELLWHGSEPKTAVHALEVYVSNLRKALKSDDLIHRRAPGYVLTVDNQKIDLRRFDELLTKGRLALEAGDAERSALLLREALALWRGAAFGGTGSGEFLLGESQRLEALRLDCLEDRIDADLRLGRHADLVGELERLVAENPFRERLCGQWMLALYRAGRQAEASAAYQAMRARLSDELGMDPSRRLQDLLTKILRQDPTLDVESRPAAKPEPPLTTNLPVPMTSFIGRSAAVAEVQRLLQRTRVVTLVGPGGIGKTRLALEIGRSLFDAYPDGVWLTELAGLTDGELISESVRLALGISEVRAKSRIDALISHLRGRCLLIILDNCEHVIGAAANVVERLASSCPKVAFLVTSRERLRIPGEQLWEVTPLSLPSATSSGGGEDIARSEAVQLFLDRAALSRSTFGLTEANSGSIAEISRRLEGIPLALELAAANVATMGTDEMTRRLDAPFELLTSGYRTASQRHQTLMGAVQWSYDLLTEGQRLMFARLSVFRGFDMQAARTVCSDESASGDACVAHTASLTDKSLVSFDGQRYRLLETLRAYASERLAQRGETVQMEAAHCGYFLGLAEGRPAGGLAAWLQRMETETGNIRAAMDWALRNDHESASRLILSLDYWWRIRSHIGEVRTYLDRLLEVREAQDSTRARLLAHQGWYGWDTVAAAEHSMESALELARALDDRLALADALLVCARYSINRSDLGRAEDLVGEALDLLRHLGSPQRVAEALHQRALVRGAQFDLTHAVRDLEESLAIRRALNQSDEATLTLAFLGGMVGTTGDLQRGRELVAEALETSRALGDVVYNHQALDITAGLAILAGQAHRGLALAAAADAALARVGWKPVEVWDRLMARYLEAGREALGPHEAAAAEEIGGGMTYREAIDYGLAWLTGK